MNALKSIGTKFAVAVVAAGLVAGAAFAADSTLTVNLPNSVTVGNTILAGGQYTVTELAVAGDGCAMFVFRDDKGDTATAVAMKTADSPDETKSSVVLSNEGGSLRLDKIFIEGSAAGFQFADSK
jgi:hypothetical protein